MILLIIFYFKTEIQEKAHILKLSKVQSTINFNISYKLQIRICPKKWRIKSYPENFKFLMYSPE